MKESLAEQLSKKFNVPLKTSAKDKMSSFLQMNESLLSKGIVVYLPLSEKEGVKPTDGFEERNKFVTIIGELPDGTIIGSLLVNTRANTGSIEIDQCQYLLKKDLYPWLDYSSWLDCSRIVSIEKPKVLLGKFCGVLREDDFNLIIQCITDTDLISDKTKKKYGIPTNKTVR